MSVISPPKASDYLASREHYLIASHKYRLFEKSLREKLGATSDAELEEAFLDPQTRSRFRAEIQAYSELGEAFDSAATNHEAPWSCKGAVWRSSKPNSIPLTILWTNDNEQTHQPCCRHGGPADWSASAERLLPYATFRKYNI
jgi:hypothetical protein